MATITAKVPDNLKEKAKQLIEELGGEIVSISKSSKKKAVLFELEQAFKEAKDIRDGKKDGITLEQILLGQ